MRVVRWNPNVKHVNRRRHFNELGRFLEQPVDRNWSRRYSSFLDLSVDVIEHDDAFVVKASIPGINPEDVDITIEDNVLTIKGEIIEEEEKEDENYHIRERRSGKFGRSLRFPVKVNADAVDATYANGVLTLDVPKVEGVKPKRIEVKVS